MINFFEKNFFTSITRNMLVSGNIIFSVLQNTSSDFMRSFTTIIIFLSILSFAGFVIVQVCKRGSLLKFYPKGNVDEKNKIEILNTKFLYGRKCLYLVSCCKKKILFLIDREHLCKLSEWEELEDATN